jgi:predicted DNA-binding transcriptional regulator AlpA
MSGGNWVPDWILAHPSADWSLEDCHGRAVGHLPISNVRIVGVYFLLSESELMYVGQSTSVVQRVAQHLAGIHQIRGVTKVAILEVPKDHLREVEAWFIRKLRPRLNATLFDGPTVDAAPPRTTSVAGFSDAEYLTPKQAGLLIGVKERTLVEWRRNGRGPKYVRLGELTGRVRYSRSEIDRWVSSRMYAHTTQESVEA